mmetsp:Transcript_23095/g.27162  ORF Transcript_23095/g.27162 Transcript_23095/m.27162 type:complete len:105 (+) Transcript_23095:48-362(+)|eukprot:CAMPEP_0114344056 /NCGR_PEP_ID=MMETSP0101-20121206/11112_1 /TAXON_ID=38822 ORGANISM="Pteridomonas danica, Strain PT" /NCGR_SAMPLE_ID=MMETSP0101 /ASSEMBLY_ACC=CAM_ASM_000211 /LENGTH=104 /DNA_ID=CAMNT_0001479171 /DNA_START=28 /DNA_END=342 /DNA_ORIENTATION=-
MAAELQLDERAIRKIMSTPLVKSTDMDPEVVADVKDSIGMILDKCMATQNWEEASKQLKIIMDKKYGAPWQVAVGEGFGFDITHTTTNMIYIFYQKVGVLMYKV